MPKDPIAFAPLASAALLDGIQRKGQQLWFHYSPELLTKRIPSLDKDGKADKEFKPFHLNGSSPNFTLGNGPAFWPLWFQSDLHDLNNAWIVEPEGEVCANYVRVGGVVATSQDRKSVV